MVLSTWLATTLCSVPSNGFGKSCSLVRFVQYLYEKVISTVCGVVVGCASKDCDQ